MKYAVWMGSIMLGVAFLLAGPGFTQDGKRSKGQLPPGWKNLELSKTQVEAIYKVRAEYRSKIRALEEQIKSLREQERADMVKVLNDQQKQKLRKLLLGEGGRENKDK
jgi:TolA-binding protein